MQFNHNYWFFLVPNDREAEVINPTDLILFPYFPLTFSCFFFFLFFFLDVLLLVYKKTPIIDLLIDYHYDCCCYCC